MKIAVTYENGNVFQHFGHTETFKIYETEDKAVINSRVVNTMGSGHGALAGFLKALDVEVLICGGIGGGAKTALADAGIELYGGVTGNADAAVEDFLQGALIYKVDIVCNHHGEGHANGEHEHNCGHDHANGEHTCGSHCGH